MGVDLMRKNYGPLYTADVRSNTALIISFDSPAHESFLA